MCGLLQDCFKMRTWFGVALALAGLAIFASPGSAARQSESKVAAAIEGTVAGYFWQMNVRRGAGQAGSRAPCASVALVRKQEGSQGTINTGCHSLSPFPLLVGNTSNSGSATRGVVGMVFPSQVGGVRAWLRGRTSRMVLLKHVSPQTARTANIEPFSYGAITFAGSSCLVRVRAYDRHMTPLGESLALPCD